MGNHYDRTGLTVLHAFNDGEELTAAQIAQRIGYRYPPYATMFRLEHYGKLSSRFIEGRKPRTRIYKRVASI